MKTLLCLILYPLVLLVAFAWTLLVMLANQVPKIEREWVRIVKGA